MIGGGVCGARRPGGLSQAGAMEFGDVTSAVRKLSVFPIGGRPVVARSDAAELIELHARVCKALADPKRLLIITELRGGPRSVGDLADALQTSQPNVSRHLAVLRDRGIVSTERAGNTVFYSLVSPKILQAVDLLREFMAEELHGQPALVPSPGDGVAMVG
jgi:ArsR family transcriptional regulator